MARQHPSKTILELFGVIFQQIHENPPRLDDFLIEELYRGINGQRESKLHDEGSLSFASSALNRDEVTTVQHPFNKRLGFGKLRFQEGLQRLCSRQSLFL